MKTKYFIKITLSSLYEDLFDKVVFDEVILPTQTHDHVKASWLEKNSHKLICDMDYDTWKFEIIKEEVVL